MSITSNKRLAQYKARKISQRRFRLNSVINRNLVLRILKIVLGLSPLLLIILVVWLIPRLILVKNFDCESQFGPCSQALSSKLTNIENKSYAQVKAQINAVLHNDFLVDQYNIRLKLPSSVDLFVLERKPEVAIVSHKDTTKFALVDNKGLVLSINNQTNLPILLLSEDIDFVVGSKLDKRISFATQELSQLYKLFNIKLATANADAVAIEMSDGTRVILPLEGELDVLFGSLNLILSRLNSGSSDSKIEEVLKFKPTVIDLRYKNPVLK